MKIGLLTSSRADYGIYLPLIRELINDDYFDLEIIAFGMHLSSRYGLSINQIGTAGLKAFHKIPTLLDGDSPADIVTTYANTIKEFGKFWSNNKYDLIFCLGDRYEMNAAIQATIPFGMKIAHIHGGETTLGATDNIYRHQITLASEFHFCTTGIFYDKIKSLVSEKEKIFITGALSLDNLKNFLPTDLEVWKHEFNLIGLSGSFILVTVHPETVLWNQNESNAKIIYNTLKDLSDKFNVIITLPNADTYSSFYRDHFIRLQSELPHNIFLVENFGTQGYFTALHFCKFLIGNTSSGIIEAASFNKYVIDIGDRQKGRPAGENVIHIPFNQEIIKEAVAAISKKEPYKGENLYYMNGKASQKILQVIKKIA